MCEKGVRGDNKPTPNTTWKARICCIALEVMFLQLSRVERVRKIPQTDNMEAKSVVVVGCELLTATTCSKMDRKTDDRLMVAMLKRHNLSSFPCSLSACASSTTLLFLHTGNLSTIHPRAKVVSCLLCVVSCTMTDR
jgi:hypothetical protein